MAAKIAPKGVATESPSPASIFHAPSHAIYIRHWARLLRTGSKHVKSPTCSCCRSCATGFYHPIPAGALNCPWARATPVRLIEFQFSILILRPEQES